MFFSIQVHPDIKLPVLYLVDSIIKNVGGAYTSKFSEKIVNMFTRTFKQVITNFTIVFFHILYYSCYQESYKGDLNVTGG